MTKCHWCKFDCNFTLMGYLQVGETSNLHEPKSICPECLYALGKKQREYMTRNDQM